MGCDNAALVSDADSHGLGAARLYQPNRKCESVVGNRGVVRGGRARYGIARSSDLLNERSAASRAPNNLSRGRCSQRVSLPAREREYIGFGPRRLNRETGSSADTKCVGLRQQVGTDNFQKVYAIAQVECIGDGQEIGLLGERGFVNVYTRRCRAVVEDSAIGKRNVIAARGFGVNYKDDVTRGGHIPIIEIRWRRNVTDSIRLDSRSTLKRQAIGNFHVGASNQRVRTTFQEGRVVTAYAECRKCRALGLKTADKTRKCNSRPLVGSGFWSIRKF